MSIEQRICVVTPSAQEYSATFIRAHLSRLPGVVLRLHGKGNYFPTHTIAGDPVLDKDPLTKLLHASRGRRGRPAAEATLAAYLRRHGINAVLAEYGPTAVAMVPACAMSGAALIAHFHGYDAHQSRVVAENEQGYKEVFRTAAAVIAASRHMKDRLVELGAPAGKVRVNHYGVDLDTFVPAAGGVGSDFLSVGRFVDKKAPQLTLLAFSRALERQPGLRLVMVGDGPLLECCRQMAAALGISREVVFPGVCSPEQIRGLLHSSRALLQHSVQTGDGDSESLGVVFLEAAACGVPAVATRHDGIPEVVIHGQTGVLVDERDIAAFSDAIVALAGQREYAARLGSQARRHAEEKFGLQRSLNGISGIIADVLAER